MQFNITIILTQLYIPHFLFGDKMIRESRGFNGISLKVYVQLTHKPIPVYIQHGYPVC